MNIETVKKELDCYLNYSKNYEEFSSLQCFHTAFGMVEMASAFALEEKNWNFYDEVCALWKEYCDLFLAEYRKELENK